LTSFRGCPPIASPLPVKAQKPTCEAFKLVHRAQPLDREIAKPWRIGEARASPVLATAEIPLPWAISRQRSQTACRDVYG
jgi:hypothetical protein